ncbi:DUF3515 domain-containing protein [Propionibacteriaceae bacterium G1746]
MGERKASAIAGRAIGGRAAAVLLAGSVLAACSGSPELAQPSPTGAVATECAAVMAALPGQLLGQGQVGLEGNLATWGDPAISVRCGVDKPASLTQTSHCDELNGVGWFTEEPGTAVKKAWRFTTIGRTGYIEVIVPEQYEPAGDALMDLGAAVKKMAVVSPCQ